MVKLKTLLLEVIGKIKVPKEPGTVPIPANHIRLFHYFDRPEVVSSDAIRDQGILLSKARGHTYGEPDMIWASTQPPENYHMYVEFSIPIEDERFTMFGARPRVDLGADHYNKGNYDLTLIGDVKPSEFIAIHEPWHHTYRYLIDGYIENVLNGDYDDLVDDPRHPKESMAIKAIKLNYGKT